MPTIRRQMEILKNCYSFVFMSEWLPYNICRCKWKKEVLPFFLIVLFCQAAFSQTCDCKDDLLLGQKSNYVDIGSITSRKGGKIQVCGFRKEGNIYEDGDSAGADAMWLYDLHSNFIVHNCKTGDTLYFEEQPVEDWLFKIDVGRTKIKITRVVFIDYSGFDDRPPPLDLSTVEISFDGYVPRVSEPIPAFRLPTFAPAVLDSANKFYKRLEGALAVPHSTPVEWAYDQYPDDLLLVAALNHIGRADEIYRHLRKYFGLDGAYDESYDEGLLDRILQNTVKE